MKKHLYIFLSILYTLSWDKSFAQGIIYDWAITAGGTPQESARSVALDEIGNIYVTGLFEESMHFEDIDLYGAGGDDIYVAKYDTNGHVLWVTKAGGLNADYGLGIAVDGDGNCFVTGSFYGDIQCQGSHIVSNGGLDVFIAKFDAEGILVWANGVGGDGYDRGCDVAVDGRGNPVVTGFYNSSVDFGVSTLESRGRSDIFVAKFDPQGNPIWAHSSGGVSTDIGYGVTVGSMDNIYVTGFFNGHAHFGSHELQSRGSEDIFVIVFNAEGRLDKVIHAGGNFSDEANDISTDSFGNIFITGRYRQSAEFGSTLLSSTGDDDLFVAKVKHSGEYEWAKSAGGTNNDIGHGVVSDNVGGCTITGSFEFEMEIDSTLLSSAGLTDVFFAHYNSAGSLDWASNAGGYSSDVGFDIARKNNKYFAVGYFDQTAMFGDISLTSMDNTDMFITSFIDTTETQPNRTIDSDRPVLYFNSPNPFNQSTLLRFYLPNSRNVTLQILDTMGKTVQILRDGYTQAGLYDIRWDANTLPNGIYLCVLESGPFIQTQKMILQK